MNPSKHPDPTEGEGLLCRPPFSLLGGTEQIPMQWWFFSLPSMASDQNQSATQPVSVPSAELPGNGIATGS